jgi:membrane complex biogenesis BtpA family protein
MIIMARLILGRRVRRLTAPSGALAAPRHRCDDAPMRLTRQLPIVGVVHLAPLPGSPRAPRTLQQVFDQARQDALHYLRAGVDALLIENHGDAPFDKDSVDPHVPAILAVVARELIQEMRVPVGINVLRNDVASALGAAVASGSSFVRANVLSGVVATDQGVIEGQAARWLRYRRQLGADVEIWADVEVKHGTAMHAPPLDVAARELVQRAGADRLLVTGAATGSPPGAAHVRAIRGSGAACPVYLASGVTHDNVGSLLPLADGAVVGSAFKADGVVSNPVDPIRVTTFMNLVRSIRLGVGAPA